MTSAINTRSSCWTCQVVDFSSLDYHADLRGGKQEIFIQQKIKYVYVRVQSVHGLQRQAECSDADHGLVCPTGAAAAVAVLLLEKLCSRYRPTVVVVVTQAT